MHMGLICHIMDEEEENNRENVPKISKESNPSNSPRDKSSLSRLMISETW
jgi:hypothetical protein